MSSLETLRAHPLIARLRDALAKRDSHRVEDDVSRRAGVAILIRLSRGDPDIFFIQRSQYEGDPWSGQIAFPGGREEPGDANLCATAIRETYEETMLDLGEHGELLGVLDDQRPLTVRLPAVIVRPFIFLVGDVPAPVLSAEVANSFWVPLPVLLDPSVWRESAVTAGGVEIRRLAFHHEGNLVWGMTERILSVLLDLVR